MKEFWNIRYKEPHFAYGKAPNAFFKLQLDKLGEAAGRRLLVPAAGEGRDAIYAAQKGWKVDAFDMSEAGQQRALTWAKQEGCALNYEVFDAIKFDFDAIAYDCIALIYAHFPKEVRAHFHGFIHRSLKPGGILMLEGFSKKQQKLSSGGPKNLQMLFDEEMLVKDFKKLKTLELTSLQTILDEGIYHQGQAEVIRYVGVKDSTQF
jgi:cyclopropane fatty-acyl-phospholipid synthase-like methyltransferase